MKIVKKIVQIVLYLFLFLFIETLASVCSFLLKAFTDITYCERVLDVLEKTVEVNGQMVDYINTAEGMAAYLGIIYEIIPQTMLISGIFALIPLFIYLKKKELKPFRFVKFNNLGKLIVLGLAINGSVSLVITLLSYIPAISNIITEYDSSVGYISNLPFIPVLIATGIVAPFIEEIFFRFFMIEKLKERKWLAIILPALFFGIAHWNLVQSTYAFLIGVLLDIIYFETRNLTNTFIIHATINSSSIIFEQTNANVGMGIMIICFVITIIYIIVLKNKNISLKEAIE